MKAEERPTGDVKRDVHDELSFHLESAVRDLVAGGMGEEEARREALRRFGSVARVERRLERLGARRALRYRRRAWAMDLGRDVRFAFRNLRRNPGWAAMMVGILAAGLAVNAAVLRVVDGALVRPLPFPDGDELVRLFAGDALEERFPLSWPEFEDWSREARFLDASAASYVMGVTLRRGAGEPEVVRAGVITGEYLDVLGIPPVAGRAITDEDVTRGERVAMLDETAWRARFGADPAVIGSSLTIDDEEHIIVGVMPASAGIPVQAGDVTLWLPFAEREFMVRTTHFLRALGRLSDGSGLASAQLEANRAGAALIEQGVTDHGIVLHPVRAQVVGPVRPVLLALSGAVVFVLLVVCANLTNLFLAQAMGRSREFAVRASLGAGRARLVRQIATEGAVIGLAGAALGLLLSRLLGDIVRTATGQAASLAPAATFDVRVAAVTLALGLFAGLVIGLWPALRAGSGSASGALASGTRMAGDRRAWARRGWLIGAEVAFTLVLVSAAGLMVRSVAHLLDRDPGFTTSNVLAFNLNLPAARYPDDAARALFYERMVRDIRELPGVEAAGAITELPLDGSDTNGSFTVVGVEYNEDERPNAKKRVVTPGYFEALGIPLLEGRTITALDAPRDVMVISESLARQHFPDGAIGRSVEFSWGPPGPQEIVGVVGDVLHDGLDQDGVPTLYRTYAQFAAFAGMTVVVRAAGDPLALAPAVRAAVRSIDPLLPVTGVRTMEQVLAQSIGDRRILMRLLAGFAGLALALAALGVYAVTAQAVRQRTREIGVRMAVGARAADVLRMVVREEMPAIGFGIFVGLLATAAVTRVLQASLFGVGARDPLTLTAAAVLLCIAALAATLLPAVRAARVDPAQALPSAG